MFVIRLVEVAVVLFLVLYGTIRMRRSGFTPELQRALRRYNEDPVAGQHELDSYFKKQAEEEQQARKLLWIQAQTDLRAAKELRRRVLEDIKTDQFARQEFSKDPEAKPEMMGQFDESEQSNRAELAKLDALIDQLRHP